MLPHLLCTADLHPADLERLLARARAFKTDPWQRRTLLENETVVLYFNKPSTRTRLSFEAAVARLGGVPVTVGPGDLQLGRGETIEDTARVMSRYTRAVGIRTFAHDDVVRFAAAAAVPVVNMLTDGHHPCQSIADLMTLREHHADLREVRLAYVGDGNNVLHSLVEAAALAGMSMSAATPPDHAPDPEVLAGARSIGRETGAVIEVGTDPHAAVADADAVYTDTWMSMGTPEEERTTRLEAFAPYRVDESLLARAAPDAIFLHCLPAHRGDEVTADVIDGPRSVVVDQAENRLHTELAVLEALLEGTLVGRGEADVESDA
jgi:ornithine carbamoyltransferase